MHEIVLTIPFNPYFYWRNQKLAWSLTVGAVSTGYIIYGIVTALVLIVGVSTDSKGGPPIVSLAGIIMLIAVLLKLWAMYRARKAFFTKAEEVAAKFEASQTTQMFRFTDEGIEYEDPFSTANLSWQVFDSVSIVKESLVLKLKEDEQIYLVLWVDEIGPARYDEIKTFLTDKLEG